MKGIPCRQTIKVLTDGQVEEIHEASLAILERTGVRFDGAEARHRLLKAGAIAHQSRKDVIVFPDRVQGNWWREDGHHLRLVDIQEALESFKPNQLVVGTGKFGIMKVGREVKRYCEANDIALYAEPTEKATKMYNRLLLTDDKVLGAFHLTC